MSSTAPHPWSDAPPARTRLSARLEETIVEIAASERALDDVLAHSERLHRANVRHGPSSCLVCFEQR